MSNSITVEGSLMPAAGLLRRGERATYADSPRLRRLIDRGYLVLISETGADEDVPVPLAEVVQLPGTEEPSRSGSTEEWREFFAKQLPDEEIPEDAGRNAIIAAWDRYKQQVTGGA